jgi:hypothetical protein
MMKPSTEHALVGVKLSTVAPQAIENLLDIVNEVFWILCLDYNIIDIGFHTLAPVVG